MLGWRISCDACSPSSNIVTLEYAPECLITHFLKYSLANPILSLCSAGYKQGSNVWTKGVDKHRLLLDIFLLINKFKCHSSHLHHWCLGRMKYSNLIQLEKYPLSKERWWTFNFSLQLIVVFCVLEQHRMTTHDVWVSF